ncbi:MAG: MFS transporter [Desulfobacterales bacterium]|jgi:NNP family nitrate/nitrite transporter-like MFS transporter
MDKSSKLSNAINSENNVDLYFLNQLGSLLILTSIFFINFVSRITPAPLAPKIEIDLNLSHADAGALFLAISLGYFITLSGSGLVSSRLNHKRTIIISNTALGFALIGTSFCSGPWTIRLGLFIVGMTAGLYLPSGIATLTSLIPSHHWGKGLAVHEAAPNLSFIAAPLICEAVQLWFSWRMVFFLIGVVALMMSPVFWRYNRGGEFKGEALGVASFRLLFGNFSFWIMILMFSLGVIGTLGVYTMLPLYLVTEHSIDVNRANTLIALSRIPCMIMAFVAGWATDRIGPRRTLRIVLLLSGLMTLFLGIASPSVILYIVFLQPVVAVCFFPAGFAAMSLIVSAKLRNIAVSFIVPLAFVIGGGLAPVFIGFLGDLGRFALGIAISGGLITAGAVFAGSLKFHGQQD